MYDVAYTGWRKSRRSNHSGNCVEVGAAPTHHTIGVRDSKQHGHGPILEFTTPAWESFTTAIREGEVSR